MNHLVYTQDKENSTYGSQTEPKKAEIWIWLNLGISFKHMFYISSTSGNFTGENEGWLATADTCDCCCLAAVTSCSSSASSPPAAGTALTQAEVPQAWVERKCQGRHEKESASKKGSGVEAILQNKASPAFQMLLPYKDCVSRVLIIHITLWYNIGIYYTEYYVHYGGYIFSIFLDYWVFIYILHSVECNTLIYDKQAVWQGEGVQGEKEGGENLTEITSLSVWVSDVMKSVCCASCLQIGL